MVLESPRSVVLTVIKAAPSPMGSLGLPAGTPNLPQHQVSAALHDPFTPSKSAGCRRLFHVACWVLLPAQCAALASTGPQLLCADLEEIIPRSLCLHDADLLLSTVGFSPQLASMDSPQVSLPYISIQMIHVRVLERPPKDHHLHMQSSRAFIILRS